MSKNTTATIKNADIVSPVIADMPVIEDAGARARAIVNTLDELTLAVEQAKAQAETLGVQLNQAIEKNDDAEVSNLAPQIEAAKAAQTAAELRLAEFRMTGRCGRLVVELLAYADQVIGALAAASVDPADFEADKQARVKAISTEIRLQTQKVWELEDQRDNGEDVEEALTNAQATLDALESDKTQVLKSKPGAITIPALTEGLKGILQETGQSVGSRRSNGSGGGTGTPRQPRGNSGKGDSKKTKDPLGNGGGTGRTPMGKAVNLVKSNAKKWEPLLGEVYTDESRGILALTGGEAALRAHAPSVFKYNVKNPIDRSLWLEDGDGNEVIVTAPDAYTVPRDLAYEAQQRYAGIRSDAIVEAEQDDATDEGEEVSAN